MSAHSDFARDERGRLGRAEKLVELLNDLIEAWKLKIDEEQLSGQVQEGTVKTFTLLCRIQEECLQDVKSRIKVLQTLLGALNKIHGPLDEEITRQDIEIQRPSISKSPLVVMPGSEPQPLRGIIQQFNIDLAQFEIQESASHLPVVHREDLQDTSKQGFEPNSGILCQLNKETTRTNPQTNRKRVTEAWHPSDTERKNWILNYNWYLGDCCSDSDLLSLQEEFEIGVTQANLLHLHIAIARASHVAERKPKFSILRKMEKGKGSASTGQLINQHLLRCSAQLCLEHPEKAMKDADAAFNLASEHGLSDLQRKSQLYRGLCFKEMRRWKEARDCFVRAASIKGWADRIPSLTAECNRKLAEAEEAAARNEDNKGK